MRVLCVLGDVGGMCGENRATKRHKEVAGRVPRTAVCEQRTACLAWWDTSSLLGTVPEASAGTLGSCVS